MGEIPERETRDIQSIDGVSGASGREGPVASDTVLSAVADEQRRAILSALAAAPDETLTFDALVDRVAARIGDDDGAGVSDERRQRVRIALHHAHLPILDEARIVDYDPDAGHVQFVGGALEREVLTLVEPYDGQE